MLVVSKSPEWGEKKKETLTGIIFLKFYFIKMVNKLPREMEFCSTTDCKFSF